MLRITRIESKDSAVTLKLDGKLLEPWVAELLRFYGSTSDPSGRTVLDLSGLTFVDQAGAKVLRDLVSRGVAISACSGFIGELLQLEKS